jgi:predicted DNA-binding antitoxin AbrB/MazE fold protein
MSSIPIIFENGVFRPTVPVVLPEGTKAEAVVSGSVGDQVLLGCPGDEIADILLNHGAETGDPFLAARHNEHQP